MKRILLVLLLGLTTACTTNQAEVDFTSWDEDDVYNYLSEVQQHVRQQPAETDSRDRIIEQYELFFSADLSKEIVDSLYVKTDSGWKVPDGDAGYIFSVPNRGSVESEVTIEYNKDFIIIEEYYEFGMFKEVAYTIRQLDNKPKITECVRVFD